MLTQAAMLGAEGQQAAVEVGAVAQVGEHVRGVGKRRLADPGHALAAHLRESAGVAVGHPVGHVVELMPATREAAIGHAGAALCGQPLQNQGMRSPWRPASAARRPAPHAPLSPTEALVHARRDVLGGRPASSAAWRWRAR